MRDLDRIGLALGALREHRLRTFLSMLGVAIGVFAVVLLASIGEGSRRFIVGEFQQFGANVLQVNPGKVDTMGLPGLAGGTTRPLTISDALSLRRLTGVTAVVPVAMGQALVEGAGRGRSVNVFGVTHEALELWKVEVGSGTFLPGGEATRGSPVCVLGPKLASELFGSTPATGQFVRIADRRLRVIGVTRPKGIILGMDMDDLAYVPVASAMAMFDLANLIEIDVSYAHGGLTEAVEGRVRERLMERHGQREDFTILSQAAMLDVFGSVMDAVTMAVIAIAGVSLLVGAVGILTTMWIAVGERTREIGLLRALGADRHVIRSMFLFEAAALSLVGGAAGLALAWALASLLKLAIPGLPLHTPPAAVLAALGVSLVTGLVAGVAPAGRAAALDPVDALRSE